MNRLRHGLARQEGFTLVELLVVIVIIGVLLAIAVPSYLGYRGRAANRVAQSDLRAEVPSAEAYAVDHGDYVGLDVSALRSSDQGISASIDNVTVMNAGAGYCIGATVNGSSWSVAGPGATWYASDDCAAGTQATP